MAKTRDVAAVDLGASHGRVIKGSFDGERLEIAVVHDFENSPVVLGGSIYWNHISLAANAIAGIAKAGGIASVGVDAWGHDFIPVTRDGSLLGSMYCYRDRRTARIDAGVTRKLKTFETYMTTGSGANPIATVCQLAALKQEEPAIYQAADTLLFVADYVSYLLCGQRFCNETQVSMGGMYDVAGRGWCAGVLEGLGLKGTWGTIARCGQIVGETPAGVKVVAVAAHDTASAFSFLPCYSDNNLILSNGTWALIGIKTAAPLLEKAAYECGLQAELGSFGEFMQICNLTGLWLLQELVKEWRGVDYQALNEAARRSDYDQIIDTQDESLAQPGNMAAKICDMIRRQGGVAPATPVEFYRCVLLSLCGQFNKGIRALETIYGRSYGAINVVGGGARNTYFNELIAQTTRKPVLAGPFEATAIGNILVQLMALGEIKDAAQAQAVLERSFAVTQY
jgi:sugar (pentulose or hexulose) kinase